MRKALQARSSESAFNPIAAQRVLEIASKIFALERISAEGKKVVCLHNVSSEEIQISLDQPFGKGSFDIFAGGGKVSATENILELNPYEFVWLRR